MKYQEWKNQIKPDRKLRTYQHIDDALDLDDEKTFQRVVKTIEEIKNHQFLPFIKREEVKIRFRKNEEGLVRRKQKIRPIMYASHMDAHIYSYYNFTLQEKYEQFLEINDLSKNVTAYRKIKIEETGKGKSNIHFAKEVFDHIEKQSDCVVVTQDIEGFFDNLNHSLLKKMICKISGSKKIDEPLYKVFRSLIAYKYIEYSDFIQQKIKSKTKNNKYAIFNTLKGLVHENRTNIGIPQGSPISGLLANIYLIDFDFEIKKSFPDVFYRRYSDDLVFICGSDQLEKLLSFINSRIKEAHLKINDQKSFITYFKKIDGNLICEKVTNGLSEHKNRDYVDYLGLEFSGKNTLLRKNTIQKLKGKQIKKIKKQALNNITPIRRNSRKDLSKKSKNKNNYFKKAIEVINGNGINKQVLKVTKDRNKLKKILKEKKQFQSV